MLSRVEIMESVLMEQYGCDRLKANIVGNILLDALDDIDLQLRRD